MVTNTSTLWKKNKALVVNRSSLMEQDGKVKLHVLGKDGKKLQELDVEQIDMILKNESGKRKCGGLGLMLSIKNHNQNIIILVNGFTPMVSYIHI